MAERIVEARTDLERYLNVRSASGAVFRHDGHRVYYLTNVSGLPQLWSVPTAGGWPEQHTFHDERVSGVACDPMSDRAVFSMDAGGSENNQLFLLTEDGSVEVQLTSDPDAIFSFGAFAPDGSHIAYGANDREKASFDIIVRPLGERGEGKPRRVLSEGGMWLPTAFHPDGKHLLVTQVKGNLDQDMYLLSLETGEKELLTPRAGEGQVRHHSAVFTPDGRVLFLLSDRGDDFLRLWRLEIDTGEWTALDAGGHDVELLVGSHHGHFLLYARNVGGCSEVHAYDPLEARDVQLEGLPRGTANSLSLSAEGRRAVVCMSTDTAPADVYVIALPDGMPKKITHSTRAGIPAAVLLDSERASFPSFDGREIPVFLYRPRKAENPPCIVWVHGGPEGQYRPGFNPIVQYFVNRGYAVCAPNVRGSTGYGKEYTSLDDVRKRGDSVKDLAECARWLKNRRDIDGERLAVLGGSYGGFMVLATLTENPELWAAGVDIVGIANLVTFLENTAEWRRPLREKEYGSLEHDREYLEEISPIHKVDRIAAPLMVIHGANDPRVPVGEAEQIVEALRARDSVVEYLRYEDEGHGIVKLANKLTCYPAIARFLDEHLAR